MDMRLGIEPLQVVEKRHILKAVEACNGNVRYAAELLDIGRATIYRKMAEWSDGNVRQLTRAMTPARDYPALVGARDGALKRRRFVERVIELHGGNLTEAAAAINYSLNRLVYSMGVWHRDNARLINEKARREGISDDEIEVMLRRRSMEEHAKRSGFTITTGYKMIDEACALVGLRRYRHWLFLATEDDSSAL